MGLAPTLIKAGAALLGGILGKSKNEYVVPNYQKIRDKAEAAGFNPLTALAMAPGQVVQSQNYMGSAIADAGLALADGLAEKAKQNDPLEKLKRENELLKEKIINVTLRPKVPGVYAQREAIPTLSQAVGGGNVQGNPSSSGAVNSSGDGGGASGGSHSPLGDLIDPTREVDPVKITSDPGAGIISNRWTGDFPVPLVNGEIPDIWQYPTIIGSFLGYQALKWANKPADPPAPYVERRKMPPTTVGRVIPNRQVHLNAESPMSQASVRAKIKAVDPSYDDRPAAPYWHKYRVNPWGN